MHKPLMIILGTLLWVPSLLADPLQTEKLMAGVSATNRCTIIYSLEGISNQTFTQQVESLRPHLKGQNFQLIDLNHWRSSAPYKEISGRQKSRLRQRFAMPAHEDAAVLLNRKGELVQRYQDTVDLVDMMLSCKGHHTPRNADNTELANQP